ncbi:MAG: NADH-quinone oxidoreductase subunit H [Acidobacteriota bacterium]
MSPALVLALKAVAYTVLVPLGAPFLEGVIRKVKAVVHSRKGPPLYQPYLDLAKLLAKEDLSSGGGAIARFAPPATFAAVLAASYLVPFGIGAPAASAGDLFLFVYLMTFASVCVIAAGLAHASPFAHLGSTREMMMLLTVEAVILISLLTAALGARTALLSAMVGGGFRPSLLVALVCFLVAFQAVLGKLPFDVAEAEQEIVEGPLIEYSGPSLALFKWAFMMKQFVYGSLFFNIFVGWPRLEGAGAYGAAVNFGVNALAVLVLCVLVALVDATNPRLTVAQSMRLFGGLIAVAVFGAGLAAAGL